MAEGVSGAEGDVCESTLTERGFVYRCHKRGAHDGHTGTAPGRVRDWTDDDVKRTTWPVDHGRGGFVEVTGGGSTDFPWRVHCTSCGWMDSFDSEYIAREWASTHNMTPEERKAHRDAAVSGSAISREIDAIESSEVGPETSGSVAVTPSA